jgi:hypothetical protein
MVTAILLLLTERTGKAKNRKWFGYFFGSALSLHFSALFAPVHHSTAKKEKLAIRCRLPPYVTLVPARRTPDPSQPNAVNNYD